jgi:PAS domain-containing protein
MDASAVLAIDLSGRTTYCNRVAEMMIGCSRPEIVGRSFDQIFKLQDASPPQAAGALMVLHRDGFEALIEHRSAPIHARDGCIIGAMIVFRYSLPGGTDAHRYRMNTTAAAPASPVAAVASIRFDGRCW